MLDLYEKRSVLPRRDAQLACVVCGRFALQTVFLRHDEVCVRKPFGSMRHSCFDDRRRDRHRDDGLRYVVDVHVDELLLERSGTADADRVIARIDFRERDATLVGELALVDFHPLLKERDLRAFDVSRQLEIDDERAAAMQLDRQKERVVIRARDVFKLRCERRVCSNDSPWRRCHHFHLKRAIVRRRREHLSVLSRNERARDRTPRPPFRDPAAHEQRRLEPQLSEVGDLLRGRDDVDPAALQRPRMRTLKRQRIRARDDADRERPATR